IFKSYKDFIILRSIPFVNAFINNINDKNLNKNKILIACLSNDDLMKKQYEYLKENLEKLAGIKVKELFLPSKDVFLDEFSESTMTHIICHGKIVDNKQVLVLENSNDKIYLSKEDFKRFKSSEFVFISSCSSLTINVNWEDTIYKEMVKNGCKTIIGTHWAIPQDLSLYVSTSFYKNFTSGKPVGMALHEALKEINNEFLSRNFYFIGNHTLTLE
ncbi:MAG: CHAT domain-containing protein, partial [Spirochaetota bacterium]